MYLSKEQFMLYGGTQLLSMLALALECIIVVGPGIPRLTGRCCLHLRGCVLLRWAGIVDAQWVCGHGAGGAAGRRRCCGHPEPDAVPGRNRAAH